MGKKDRNPAPATHPPAAPAASAALDAAAKQALEQSFARPLARKFAELFGNIPAVHRILSLSPATVQVLYHLGSPALSALKESLLPKTGAVGALKAKYGEAVIDEGIQEFFQRLRELYGGTTEEAAKRGDAAVDRAGKTECTVTPDGFVHTKSCARIRRYPDDAKQPITLADAVAQNLSANCDCMGAPITRLGSTAGRDDDLLRSAVEAWAPLTITQADCDAATAEFDEWTATLDDATQDRIAEAFAGDLNRRREFVGLMRIRNLPMRMKMLQALLDHSLGNQVKKFFSAVRGDAADGVTGIMHEAGDKVRQVDCAAAAFIRGERREPADQPRKNALARAFSWLGSAIKPW